MVTDLGMSLKAKFNQLFKKETARQSLGIALSKSSVSVCLFDSHSQAFNQDIFVSTEHQPTAHNLSQALEQWQLHGQGQLVLAPGQYFNVQIEPPKVPEAELEQALKWAIKDLVPLNPEHMLLDYYFQPLIGNSVNKLNVVVSDINEVKPWLSTFEQHNIKLGGITTEEFSASNLLGQCEQATLLLFQQPGEEIILLIVKQGEIYFSRRLRGFSQIADKSQQELSFGVIDSLTLEIQRSVDYFERQLKQAPISQAKVLLPIENEDYVIEQLNQNASAEVTLLDLPAGIKRTQAVCYGALLEHDYSKELR
jgi:Tfp pilus assembly PilM family ATPase